MIKVCMVTGHRTIETEQSEWVKSQLREKIQLAIEDGYTHFISGFAEGVDLWFASIVAEYKKSYPIKLVAAIPYRNRLKTSNPEFQRLLRRCDLMKVYEEEYTKGCFMKRNQGMVQLSCRVIAVYDGREGGGTQATMKMAQKLGKEIQVITI